LPVNQVVISQDDAFSTKSNYRPATVSVVLNSYLRDYSCELSAHKAHLEQVSIQFGASQNEKSKALKEINELNNVFNGKITPVSHFRIYIDKIL